MEQRNIIFLNSVFFVIGFVIIFSLLGILFQTVLTHSSFAVMNAIRIIGGIIILVFGVLIIASVRYVIPFFSTEHKVRFKKLRNSYLTSMLFGIGFALGWTPCVGAILGSIYLLAAATPSIGFLLLLAYSFGLGIPFLIFGASISKLSDFMKRIKLLLKYFYVISGIFLIVMGILVITGYIGELAVFLVGPGTGMQLSNQLNFFIAIVAGILTFVSPCILPLLPAYLSYMAGTATQEAKK